MTPKRYPPESRVFRDEKTGTATLQWTSGSSMNHHCYFTNPTTSPDGSRGYFISYRTGYPNMFAIDFKTHELTQLSDRVDINPFSPAPSRTEAAIFLSAQNQVRRIDTQTGEDLLLCEFSSPRLGNCSLNPDGSLLAIGVRYDDHGELVLVETTTGRTEVALRAEEVGHIQFCPINDQLLMYSGSAKKRIWCLNRKSGENRWVYPQEEGDWIVHETWRGESDEIIFPHWPYALKAIRADGTGLRTIAEVNAWHICSNAQGSMVVCDTNHPDRGLLLIDPDTGTQQTLCYPEASLRGTQWEYDTPAVGAGIDTSIIRSDDPKNDPPPSPDDKASTYGPQWSHPHPTFRTDGKEVIYTSDRDRYSHVYSVEVPEKSGD